jgi:hypothetical protein
MNRETLSKRVRFEVFKRDGFCCTYCGATPMQSALHIDHVVAVVNGGTNDPQNLVTACADCNLGKGAVPLEKKKLSRVRVTEADQDHAEQIREWLAVQAEVSRAKDETLDLLVGEWERLCGTDGSELYSRLPRMLEEFGYQRVLEAFSIVGNNKPRSGFTTQLKYLYGVLRRWRGEVTNTAVPAVPQTAPTSQATNAPSPTQEVSTRPLSRHAQRCLRAVKRVLQDIKARPESYPSSEAREDAVFNAFMRAAWASTPIRPLSFYRKNGMGFTTFLERGVTLVVYEDGSLSIEDEEDFNPYMQAYIELSHVAADASAPYAACDTQEEQAANLGKLWRLRCELELWLALFSHEAGPDELEYYREQSPYREILAEWDLES